MQFLKFEEYNKYKLFLAESFANKNPDNKYNSNLDEILKQAQDNVEEAVVTILGKYKFFAEFAYGMRFVYTYHVDTMATDNKNIFVNPIFCNWLSSKGRVFVICHEILHCLLLHFTRADAKHLNIKFEDIREKWNHATDYEINLLLVDEEIMTFDEVKNEIDGLIDKQWIGKTAEFIYDNMPDLPKKPQKGADGTFPATVGDYVELKDGTYGVIEKIHASGEYEIKPVSVEELNKAFGI